MYVIKIWPVIIWHLTWFPRNKRFQNYFHLRCGHSRRSSDHMTEGPLWPGYLSRPELFKPPLFFYCPSTRWVTQSSNGASNGVLQEIYHPSSPSCLPCQRHRRWSGMILMLCIFFSFCQQVPWKELKTSSKHFVHLLRGLFFSCGLIHIWCFQWVFPAAGVIIEKWFYMILA